MKWFHDCLLPQGFQLLELCQTTSEDTCFSTSRQHSTAFFVFIPKVPDIFDCFNHWKNTPVCFCYTAQWGWDSLHPQINLEGSALSAFYEENPPGDESWEYSQWQGRSCETGWFGPGWTFDGELSFHWGLPLSKSQHNKTGLPWRIWHVIIILSTIDCLLLTFLMQNKLRAVEFVYFHTVLHFTSKKCRWGGSSCETLTAPVGCNLVWI